MAQWKTQVVDSINQVDKNQWNHIISQSVSGTVFQRVGWLQAIETGSKLDPKHVIVRKNGNPVAVCPNFVSSLKLPVSLPFDMTKVGFTQLLSGDPGFGGPAIVGNKKQSLTALLKALDDIGKDNGIFHVMRILDSDHLQYAHQLRNHGYRPSLLSCRFCLRLDEYHQILNRMDKTRRKEIRDAKKQDYAIQEENITYQSVREFYTEYLKTMDSVGSVPFSFAFFDALRENLGERLEIFTAYVDGHPVGKYLYLRDDEQNSFHHFFAGVSEQHFEYSSPALLHDYAIQWAIENNYITYDFGSTNANYAHGTFKYKQKYGAEIEPIYEWEKGNSLVRWPLYRSARELYWRHSTALEE